MLANIANELRQWGWYDSYMKAIYLPETFVLCAICKKNSRSYIKCHCGNCGTDEEIENRKI